MCEPAMKYKFINTPAVRLGLFYYVQYKHDGTMANESDQDDGLYVGFVYRTSAARSQCGVRSFTIFTHLNSNV